MLNRAYEVRSDILKCLSLRFDHGDSDMDDGNFCKRGENGEEVPNYVVDLAECLVDPSSSLSAFKVKEIISTLRQEKFDWKMVKDCLSSMADCNRTTNLAWKQCPVEAQFERELIKADRDVLYRKNVIEVLPRKWHFENVHGDV